MAEITGVQQVGMEMPLVQSLNLEPGRAKLPVAGIKTHDFEALVDHLVPLIENVKIKKDGSFALTFSQEPSWDSGVVSTTDEAIAGVALVARSAAYMAAKLKLAGGEVDVATTIQMRELGVDATNFLTKHPWFNNPEAQFGMRPVSVVEALRVDPQYLTAELKPVRSKWKLAASLSTLTATAISCGLAGPGPAPIVTEAPSVMPSGEIMSVGDVTHSLEPWKAFTIGDNAPIEMTGHTILPLDATQNKILTVNPANPDGTPNTQVEYTIAGTVLTTGGKDYPTPFLVKFDKTAKTTTAYMLQFNRTEGTKTFYDAGAIDANHKAYLAPFQFVLDAAQDGTKFYLVQTGTQPQAPMTSPEPTAVAQIINVAFKTKNTDIPASLTPTPDTGTPTAVTPEVHPASITVGSETIAVTVAEGRDGAPTMAIATETKGAYYIQNGNEWLKVDPTHIEATWPTEIKDKIPTLLSADAAGDRAAADAAPDTEWHTDSDYLTKEIIMILKASGVDTTQFSVEGKTLEEAMKIKDSLFDAWISWNEQNGITLTSAPESLIAAVVSYGPNYTVYAHYGTEPGNEKMTFGWNATGTNPPGSLEANVALGYSKTINVRGETFGIFVNSRLEVDGKHRILLHRIGYSNDNPIDVIGLENHRNALVVLMPKDSKTIEGDLCVGPVVIGQRQETISCEAGQTIGHTYDFRKYPGYIISYDDNYPQALMDNPGAQVRVVPSTMVSPPAPDRLIHWLDGIPTGNGSFYSTVFK